MQRHEHDWDLHEESENETYRPDERWLQVRGLRVDELHSSFPPPFCKAEGIALLHWDTSAWPGFRSYGRELLVPVLRVLPLPALHQPAFTDLYACSRYSLRPELPAPLQSGCFPDALCRHGP